jgi:hypothetical protein
MAAKQPLRLMVDSLKMNLWGLLEGLNKSRKKAIAYYLIYP